MRKSNNYSINFEEGTITITKKFGKAASQIGTPEFKEMKELRKEFEGFKFVYKTIERKENKKTYKNLTIATMKEFIGSLENSEEELTKFENVEELVKDKKGKYAIIKKWFLDNYKEQYSNWSIMDSLNKELSLIEDEIDDAA